MGCMQVICKAENGREGKSTAAMHQQRERVKRCAGESMIWKNAELKLASHLVLDDEARSRFGDLVKAQIGWPAGKASKGRMRPR